MDPADSQSSNKQQKVGENRTVYTLRTNCWLETETQVKLSKSHSQE